MHAFSELLKRLGHTRWFAWMGSRMAPRADRALHRLLGRPLTPSAMPSLWLTTVGRRSGRHRTVPLLYVPDGSRWIVAGSNWGRREHPSWSANLLANPAARVEVAGLRSPCLARLATADERQRLWDRLVGLWPAYDTYRARAGREIRVFVLEPAAGDDAGVAESKAT